MSLRAIPAVNSSRRLGIFSREFTPKRQVQYLIELYGLGASGRKIAEKIPNILRKAQREWLSKPRFLLF